MIMVWKQQLLVRCPPLRGTLLVLFFCFLGGGKKDNSYKDNNDNDSTL